MNILTFTTLWPNAEQSNFGIFVKHRVAALAELEDVNVRVVAPVPYFPKTEVLLPRSVLNRLPESWRLAAKLPEQEEIGGLQTFHPRYLVTPKIGMSFYGGWMASGAWETIRRLHAEQPIDLIDAHCVYPDGYAATILGRKLNIPVFITARGTDINLFSRMPLIRPKIVKALSRAAGVVAVSEALKRRMIELGIPSEKIAVIRNGIDRKVFYQRDRNEARQHLGIDPEDRILLTVAALVPVKGIDRLIDAMALLRSSEQGNRLKLFVIGEGRERRTLESQILNLKLQNSVRLIGARPQSELADWYSAADLFCLASHGEGCPNVIVEALACGLRVVVADVGGVAELIDSPTCGRLVSLPTPERFAAEIRAAFASVWVGERLAAPSAACSWDEVAAEIGCYFTDNGNFAKD